MLNYHTEQGKQLRPWNNSMHSLPSAVLEYVFFIHFYNVLLLQFTISFFYLMIALYK